MSWFRRLFRKPDQDPLQALRYPAFRIFLASRFLQTVGFTMQVLVVELLVYRLTRDPLYLGFIGLTEAVPAITVALFGGWVADRFNRRTIILINQLVVMLNTGVLAYVSGPWAGSLEHNLWPIYLAVFFSGLARGLMGPSVFSFRAQLIPREVYPNAASWASTLWQIGTVIGPALGGLLFAQVGPTNSYLTVLVLLGVSWLFIFGVKARPVEQQLKRESIWRSLREGLQFVFRRQVLVGALALDMFAVLFGGVVSILPVFGKEILHVGDFEIGLLRTAPAVGAVVMALVLAVRPPVYRSGYKLLFSVAGFGLCMIGFALSKNYYLSFGLLVLSGSLDMISVVIRSTILQLATPENMLGRVSAVNRIFVSSSNEIGGFESGAAARLMGTVTSVVFGGAVTLAVTGYTALKAPRLRRLELAKLQDSQHNAR